MKSDVFIFSYQTLLAKFFRNLSVIMGLKLIGVKQREERVGPNYTKLINNNDNNNNNDDDVFIC